MSTETVLMVVWAIGLLGALPLTVIAVIELSHVLVHSHDLEILADTTLRAAQGISHNLESLPRLIAVRDGVVELTVSMEGAQR